MSLSQERFEEFFRTLWGYDPFPWQTRLAKQVFSHGWPDCIDLPTASGKTTCIDIAVFVLACQAGLDTKARTVGRRIFFAVNRRVIVDEAFRRAKTIAQALLDANDGILKEVADALHELSGDNETPPLDIAQLRGGIYRDCAWARSITQPMVVCTTADQFGSRLLFRGYGVSPAAAPIHAALCGCDSLVLLDEAHVTRAFSQTMQRIVRYQKQHEAAPGMRFVQMTATPAGHVKNRFGLDQADRAHLILKARQETAKPAELVVLEKKKPITDKVISCAFDCLSDTRKAVGIIVNRVQTAREIERQIQEEIVKRARKDGIFEAEVYLIIGRMRPIDRDILQETLRTLVGPDRPEILNKPIFVVATQCLEVGADYDFDVLITECASIDALRQRFGRLNRQGRSIETYAAIVTNEESIKGDDPIYGDAIKHTWEWLLSKKGENGQIDFGISNFEPLWQEVEKERATYLNDGSPKLMLSPAQNAAVLLPAHLDSLCQTAPQPIPSPDVSYFIHGPQRDNAEVNVCWRADLGEDVTCWPDIVRLLPPTTFECMTLPLRELRRWMAEVSSKDDRDADVPVQEDSEEGNAKKVKPTRSERRPVVVWRGTNEVGVIESPNELRPNDTVIMPVEYGNWNQLGHIPECKLSEEDSLEGDSKRCLQSDRKIDVAEKATSRARLSVVVRIHPAFDGSKSLYGLSDPDLRTKLIERGTIPITWNNKPVARIERHQYPKYDEEESDAPPDEVIIFKRLLDSPDKLVRPTNDEDDGDDNLSERDQSFSLEDHAKHVASQLGLTIETIHLNGLESAVRMSAPLHDIGKADFRFQAMLSGVTPYEAMMRPALLAKGDGVRRTKAEIQTIRDRAMYPRGFRHEMLSIELIEHLKLEPDLPHRDLLLHLIAAHHGHARPFAPVCFDNADDDELRSIQIMGHDISGVVRKAWIPSHRLDSGVAERFWKLTREHGWWGLAWLESILRLADQQASAAEQTRKTP